MTELDPFFVHYVPRDSHPTNSRLWKLMDSEQADLRKMIRKAKPEDFKSLFVDYEPPFVERLWYQLEDDYRVFLHLVHGCDPIDTLWHPHPWPSIVRVLDTGSCYEHGVGYDTTKSGMAPPAVVQRIKGELTYVMEDPHAWHYVAPESYSLSLMIVGKPFPKEELSPGYRVPTKKLEPLPENRVRELIAIWNYVLNRNEVIDE